MQYAMEGGQPPKAFQNLLDSVIDMFKVSQPSRHGLRVVELDEDDMPVNQPTEKVSPITPLYVRRSILRSDETWGNAGRSV